MSDTARRAPAGRPEATSHSKIEQAAFRIFGERGFDATTLDAIAADVGVARRTLSRYYASKNDIPWGQFDRTLDTFRDILVAQPADVPVYEAVHNGVLDFNRFPAGARPSHRERMRLILQTPTLQAHSVLRYAKWRSVIAEYVAERLGLATTDLLPQTVGHVSLALALTAYEQWLNNPRADLEELLEGSMSVLRRYLGCGRPECCGPGAVSRRSQPGT